MKNLYLFILTITLVLATAFSGCIGGNPVNTPSPTTSPTITTTSSPTVSPTITVTISPTISPTPSPIVSPTASLLPSFTTMIRVPGVASFPTGTDDSGECTTVNYPFYMARTEVTYQQWSIVYDWAISNGYIFANPGSRGGYYNTGTYLYGTFTTGHETDPVTTISWREAIVWCNALTEYHNVQNGATYDCVYKSAGNPIRNATDTTVCDNVIPDTNAKGFRLPTIMEWELAARYKDGTEWTPGSYASGATADYTNAGANGAVAWYSANSNVSAPNLYSTQPVCGKAPNALNLCDISGNVWEWCFESNGTGRALRGGSWYHNSTNLQLGFIYYQTTALNDAGVRFVRTE